MLQLSLLPALVAPTFAPLLAPTHDVAQAPMLCAAELSRALPSEAIAVVLVGDLGQLLLGDDVGQWARFLRDERWVELLASVAESEGQDVDALRPGLGHAHAVMQGVQAGAFAAVDTETDLSGVLRVTEGWFEDVRARVLESGGGFEETTCNGLPALSSKTQDDAGTFLLVHAGAHAFMAADSDVATATAKVAALSAALAAASEDTTERWWLDCDARVAGASLELFMDFAATMPAGDLEEMTAALGAPGALYGAIVLGEGRKAEAVMSIDFEGGPVMEAIANSLVTADTALFSLVPTGYTGTIFGLDLLAAIEEALAFAEETTPGASTDYDQGLEAIAGVLGVDLEEDLLAHLTGQILMLQPAVFDIAAIAELSEDPTALGSLMPVLGFQIDDVDAVVGVLEALFEAAAGQGLEAETAEIAGGSLWTFDPGMGTTIAVAAGSGWLAFGTEQGVVDLFAQAAKPSEERALDKDLAALASELDGAVVSATTMASALESVDSLEELLATLGEDDEESAVMADLMTSVAEIAGDHLSGVMAGEMRFTTKRVSYRMLSH